MRPSFGYLVQRVRSAFERHWGFLIALLFALVACIPFLSGPGIVNTRAGGDSPFLLQRLQQMVSVLRAGSFPVRWMPDAAYGLGYPFFNYYAALPYYLASLFVLLGSGYVLALKLTQLLGMLAAAAAMYGLAKCILKSQSAALLAAVAYTYAPFHLVNVYVRGDSLSEFYAFAFYPLILWMLARLRIWVSPTNIAAVALAYGGLLLTHNISALIFTPFACLYALWLWMSDGGQRGRFLASGLLGGLLGAGLGAWFWFPALTERDLVQLAENLTGYFHYSGHFRSSDLVQWIPIFNYTIDSHRTPFCMGMVQCVLGLVGLVAVVWYWIRRRRPEKQSLYFVLMLVCSTLLITPLSRVFWDHIPLLPYVQFPWRFLSVQALAISMLMGYALAPLPRERIVAFSLALVIAVTALAGLRVEHLHVTDADVTPERLMLYELFSGNIGSTVRHEYLPAGVNPRPYSSAVLLKRGEKPSPLILEGTVGEAVLVSAGPLEEVWRLEVESPNASVAFYRYYFPGWMAYVDGQPIRPDAVPGLGYARVRLPQGSHRVALRFERTRRRALSEAISLLALFIIGGASFYGARPGQGVRIFTTIMITICALALIFALRNLFIHRPARGDDLTMDWERMPYLHHNPKGVRFDFGIRLNRYRFSASEVTAGQTLSLDLDWEGEEKRWLEVEAQLVTAADHLFGYPYPLASVRTEAEWPTTRLQLRIPDDIPRGVYLIALRLWGGEAEIKALSERGERLGTIYLCPLWVRSAPRQRTETILARYGENIALVGAAAQQVSPERLNVQLTWRCDGTISRNYVMSLRLLDGEGHRLAQRDIQPFSGLYPTSAWRPGEQMRDRQALDLPWGIAPGKDYALEVILYDAATMQPIGSTLVPGIVLDQLCSQVVVNWAFLYERGLTLVKLDVDKTEVEQGGKLVIRADWAALAQPSADYLCRLSLLDDDGREVLGRTVSLVEGYPTSTWPANAFASRWYDLRIGKRTPPGEYQLAVSLIDETAGKVIGRYIAPIRVRVSGVERVFTIPSMQTRLNVSLGDQLFLLGYDLTQEDDRLRMTLHWQARREMPVDYVVFVHLLEAGTERIAAQRDAMPQGGAYPTSRWAEGEVVSDEFVLDTGDVAPGDYLLAVGVYDGATLVRLPASGPPRIRIDDDRVFLPTIVRIAPR